MSCRSREAADAVAGHRNTAGFFSKHLDETDVYWIRRALSEIHLNTGLDPLYEIKASEPGKFSCFDFVSTQWF